MAEDRPDCCFDEWASQNAARARKRGTAAHITRSLLAALDDQGLEGRTPFTSVTVMRPGAH